MTADAANPTNVRTVSSRKQPKIVRAASPEFLSRGNRWRRRGSGGDSRKIYRMAGLALCLAAGAGLAILTQPEKIAQTGPDGPFAQALLKAFPEAVPSLTSVSFGEVDGHGALPMAATLHLPAYLLGGAADDPFVRLGTEFGTVQGMLSGPEMGARIERVAAEILPPGLPRCHTYKLGEASLGEAKRMRALHIHLNPGC